MWQQKAKRDSMTSQQLIEDILSNPDEHSDALSRLADLSVLTKLSELAVHDKTFRDHFISKAYQMNDMIENDPNNGYPSMVTETDAGGDDGEEEEEEQVDGIEDQVDGEVIQDIASPIDSIEKYLHECIPHSERQAI